VLEKCEQYKKLEPWFSLHLGELTQYFKEIAKNTRGRSGSDHSRESSMGSIFTGFGEGFRAGPTGMNSHYQLN